MATSEKVNIYKSKISNMNEDKVSEKAIWEGSIMPDSDPSPIALQTQSQMMFCYKCNNVIPNNSNYCPYCKVKLYTECPKCGVKYSSQYPFCNQCGTNRDEYLRLQREEQERRDAIERENKRRQEIIEREKQERERQERLRIAEEKAKEERVKAKFEAENREIMKTEEYKSTYSLLSEAISRSDKKMRKLRIVVCTSCCIIMLIFLLMPIIAQDLFMFDTILISFILLFLMICYNSSSISDANENKYRRKFVLKYVLERNVYYDKEEMRDIIDVLWKTGLSEQKVSYCCIIAYRKKHGLPIEEEMSSR